jgi:hypothetical protein
MGFSTYSETMGDRMGSLGTSQRSSTLEREPGD